MSPASFLAWAVAAVILAAVSEILYVTAFVNADIVSACVLFAVPLTVTVPAFVKNADVLAAIFVAVSVIS